MEVVEQLGDFLGCYRHLDRVATCGLPAPMFAPHEPDQAPPPFQGEYLYVCEECRDVYTVRREQTRIMWVAEVDRRRAAGVPEGLWYA